MNSLNSILIEGTVTAMTATPADTEPDGIQHVATCRLELESYRDVKKWDGTGSQYLERTALTIPVECFGKLAESCAKYLEPGRGIRAVGRIMSTRHPTFPVATLAVMAEHIEFKPVFTRDDHPEIVPEKA